MTKVESRGLELVRARAEIDHRRKARRSQPGATNAQKHCADAMSMRSMAVLLGSRMPDSPEFVALDGAASLR